MEKQIINLWNTSHKKTVRVINYIEELEPLPSFTFQEIKIFEKVKRNALKQDTANAMLKFIGYEPLKIDKIYYLSKVKKRDKIKCQKNQMN